MHLELAPYQSDFRPILEEQLADPLLTRWLPFAYPLEPSELDHMLEAVRMPGGQESALWLVWAPDISTSQYVGAVGMQVTGYRHLAQLFYWVSPAFQGRGIATEMLRVMRRTVLRDWEYRRLQALVAPENQASIRALEKAGLHREGLLRRYFVQSFSDPDHLIDVYIYAAIASDVMADAPDETLSIARQEALINS